MPGIDRHCAFCLVEVPAKDVLRCSKCRRRAYCSKECQRADWRTPNPEHGNNRPMGQGHKNWCGLEAGEEDLDWKVAPVEGKGLGLIALRAVPDRFRIMVDACQPNGLTHPATQDLMPLNGSLEDKFNLNSLEAGYDDEDVSVGVLCLRISRANHNCNANAVHWWDNDFKATILYSDREIALGEEICISYSTFNAVKVTSIEDMTPDKTREPLKNHWGIECPTDCVCRNIQVIENVKRAREADEKIQQLGFRRATVGQSMQQIGLLMELHNMIHSCWMAKRWTMEEGLEIGVSTQDTMEEGRQYARQLHEVCASILHPKEPMLLDYEKWRDDVSSHPRYLSCEREGQWRCVIA